MPERNPYETLCISPSASTTEIENAYAGFKHRYFEARGTMDKKHLDQARAKMAQRKKAYRFLKDRKSNLIYAVTPS